MPEAAAPAAPMRGPPTQRNSGVSRPANAKATAKTLAEVVPDYLAALKDRGRAEGYRRNVERLFEVLGHGSLTHDLPPRCSFVPLRSPYTAHDDGSPPSGTGSRASAW